MENNVNVGRKNYCFFGFTSEVQKGNEFSLLVWNKKLTLVVGRQ